MRRKTHPCALVVDIKSAQAIAGFLSPPGPPPFDLVQGISALSIVTGARPLGFFKTRQARKRAGKGNQPAHRLLRWRRGEQQHGQVLRFATAEDAHASHHRLPSRCPLLPSGCARRHRLRSSRP